MAETKPLVVVESPTKVRTLKKYLGKNYNIAATVGHIKDLPPKEMGIDIEDGFTPKYRTIPGKQKVITALKKAASNAEDIYLAPDPDREGEAIAWHLTHALGLDPERAKRVVFNEITRTAILNAFKNPRGIDEDKVNAQQARRIVDRLVGYKISPLLWKKVGAGLSAGRVQSVAVKLVVERDLEIEVMKEIAAKKW